jgi:ribosomal protein S1
VGDHAEIVRAGQIVKVKVLTVDAKAKRIALTIKVLSSSGGYKGEETDCGSTRLPSRIHCRLSPATADAA